MTSKERREAGMLFIAAGNPCRVIRCITEEDKEFYYKQRKIDEEVLKEIYGK